ncbi:DUF6625 family protein [Bizionia paragorgiae]|uniref:DUF6625 family protein n=1 Tax=Bizionia paragorgiae TaxID=283786 RepID=UPI003A8DFC50
MKSILFIIPYIGKWPLWFDAHLVSMANNPTINWIFITDADKPVECPENVQFVKTTLTQLNQEVSRSLGVEVNLSPRKICDIRPAFGKVFEEHIKGYDFWGFCDVDIIWGDIRKFITDALLEQYDIISALENMICGHFTIFKNHEKNLYIYKNDPNYKEVFGTSKHLRYDEVGFTKIVSKLEVEGLTKVFWDEKLLQGGIKSEVHQEYFLDRWLYKEGAVYDLYDANKMEYMYLHFINWKRTMTFSEIKFQDKPAQFFISYNGMHYQPHSQLAKIFNGFKNLFNGYYVILFRKRLVKKIQKKLK